MWISLSMTELFISLFVVHLMKLPVRQTIQRRSVKLDPPSEAASYSPSLEIHRLLQASE